MLRAGAQQGASASGGDLAIMLVTEVYNKAEWEITGRDDDAEGRARKSRFSVDSSAWLFGIKRCSCLGELLVDILLSIQSA